MKSSVGWRLALWVGAGLGCAAPVHAQQVVDTAYRPRLESRTFASGSGPLVRFDASHNNPPLDSTLLPLRRVLEADGYSVEQASTGLDSSVLAGTDVLVIIDALADRNVGDWTLPTPSAIDAVDRRRLVDWVRAGGALLLVADHMPFAGAADDLGKAFGIETLNGFAIDTVSWDPIIFRRSDGTLREHPIVDGRNKGERIDSVFTYWGHAFRDTSASSGSFLVFADGVVSMQPREAWRFGPETETLPVGGWSQGMALSVGRGRVVVLGDSGMLTAHLIGPARRPVGLNAPEGAQNEQLVLNIFHWLSRLLN